MYRLVGSMLILSFTLFCTGCGSAQTESPESNATVTVRDVLSEPVAPIGAENQSAVLAVFAPCAELQSDDMFFRGFAAIILALEEAEWELQKMDPDKHQVIASACVRNNPNACASIQFECMYDRTVVAQFAGSAASFSDLRDHADRWLVRLKQIYSKYRCYTHAALEEGVVKYGFKSDDDKDAPKDPSMVEDADPRQPGEHAVDSVETDH